MMPATFSGPAAAVLPATRAPGRGTAVDCLIVGGGPAGLTAALYLRRYHRSVLLLDDGHSRAQYIDRSHNYPGFPDGISGAELLQRLRRQLVDLGGEVVPRRATGLRRLAQGFEAVLAPEGATATADLVRARTVLLATGVVDEVPPLPGIEAVRRHGLLRQCPICDGHEHRGQRIAVLGDGAHAEREARFIAHYSPQVWLASMRPRGGRPDAATPPADDGANADAPLRRLPAAACAVTVTADGHAALQLQDGSQPEFDVLYAALGVAPRSQLAQSLGAELDEDGTLVVDGHCRTSVPGLHAAGDVVSGLDQLTVATGQGAIAATAIHNGLRGDRPGRSTPAPAAAEARAG